MHGHHGVETFAVAGVLDVRVEQREGLVVTSLQHCPALTFISDSRCTVDRITLIKEWKRIVRAALVKSLDISSDRFATRVDYADEMILKMRSPVAREARATLTAVSLHEQRRSHHVCTV